MSAKHGSASTALANDGDNDEPGRLQRRLGRCLAAPSVMKQYFYS